MKDNEEERSIDNLNLKLKLEKRTNMPYLLTPLTSPSHKATGPPNARQRSPSSSPLASPLLLEVDKARHILHPPQPRADGTQGFGHE